MERIKLLLTPKRVLAILFIMFTISVLFRSIMAITYCEPNVFYDELLHFNLSKSGLGQPMMFRGLNTNRTSTLYSFVLSMTHLNATPMEAHHRAQIINALLMSSALFPAYLIGKNIIDKRIPSLFLAFLSIIIPEMIFTGKILQENLHYPLMMWFLYSLLKYIKNGENSKRHLILLALINVLLYISKDIAIGVWAAIVLYYLTLMIVERKDIRQLFIKMVLYTGVFLIGIYTCNKLAIILNQSQVVTTANNNVVERVLTNAMDIKIILNAIYPVFTYIITFILIVGVFPLLLPFTILNKLEQDEKHIIYVLGMLLLVAVGMIYITITVIEDPSKLDIRIHYRYLFYFALPIWALFIRCYKELKEKTQDKIYLLLIIVLLVAVFITNSVPTGAYIDAPSLQIVQQYKESNIVQNTLKLVVTIYIGGISYALLKKKIKLVYISVFSVLVVTMILNNYVIYKNREYPNKVDVNKSLEKIKFINDYIKNDGEITSPQDILFIEFDRFALEVLEMFLDAPYNVANLEDLMKCIEKNNGVINFKDLQRTTFYSSWKPEEEIIPKYIVASNGISIRGYDEVLKSGRYNLYKDNPNTQIKKKIPGLKIGIQSSGYIKDIGKIILFPETNAKEHEIKLKLSTNGDKNKDEDMKTEEMKGLKKENINVALLNNAKLVYRDVTGEETELVITKEEKEYTIIMRRENIKEPFILELIPEKDREIFLKGMETKLD